MTDLTEIRHVADNCFRYNEIKETEDTLELQEDGRWVEKWGMRFKPVKCKFYAADNIQKAPGMVQLTGKSPRKLLIISNNFV